MARPSSTPPDGQDLAAKTDRHADGNDQVPPVFKSIRQVRGFEEVAAQIESAIASGALSNGDRLPNEHTLSSMFGVSRTTLREAIRALEAVGIVEVRRGAHGGIFVAEPGVAQAAKALNALVRFRGASARDLAEVRASFEAETAFWAAKRASDEDIDELERIAGEFSAACKADAPWADLVALDLALHERVATASGNQVRLAVTLALHSAIREAALGLENEAADDQFRRREARELLAIARAIKRRDGPRARQMMRRHVKWNAQLEEQASG